MQVGIQHQVLRQRQYAQLDASSETTGVRYMPGVANPAAVQFRQAVHEIVLRAFNPVVHAQVDNLHVLGDRVALHELFRIAMSGTEEQKVDAI